MSRTNHKRMSFATPAAAYPSMQFAWNMTIY